MYNQSASVMGIEIARYHHQLPLIVNWAEPSSLGCVLKKPIPKTELMSEAGKKIMERICMMRRDWLSSCEARAMDADSNATSMFV
jgi:hypothetical protein